MHVQSARIRNFRLLDDVELTFEQHTTVIVGRNNSGKTSLTELFKRMFAGDSPRFELEDFSLGAIEQFWNGYVLKCKGRDEQEVRAALPNIEASLEIMYDDISPLLSKFIVDLDRDAKTARIEIRYELQAGKVEDIFRGLPTDPEVEDSSAVRCQFFKAIAERLPRLYRAQLEAVDPQDASNRRTAEWSNLKDFLRAGFINAQRGLDDTTHRTNEVLGKILQGLFESASLDSSDPKDREIVEAIKREVDRLQGEIDGDFRTGLSNLLPTFSLFGYPGLVDPRLRTETRLDVNNLLVSHTSVRYEGVTGVNLPEAYNGLGVRNLIYILLRVLEFFKQFKAESAGPDLHLIFIEEPEAHLHPQMQEVFIRQLEKIVDQFNAQDGGETPWSVQFIVTTHSSHVANEAPFQSIRYFLAVRANSSSLYCRTVVKDLRRGIGGDLKDDYEFLHKYMTLTRCDLFFADKAILIEGTVERLLLPRMIDKVDANSGLDLGTQYVSVVEVNGAYAHLFFKLLNFLELRTLVITDLDSAKEDGKGNLVACRVSEGTRTTNVCIRRWFDDDRIAPSSLIQKPDQEKLRQGRRLAYEVPETAGTVCGRSFEGAFMLANVKNFELSATGPTELENEVWGKTVVSLDKTGLALRFAIEVDDWVVPRYITEGLAWLAASDDGVAQRPMVAESAAQASLRIRTTRE